MVGYKEEIEKINNNIFIVSEDTTDLFGKRQMVILDTSVIVKWFFKEGENNTKNAELLLQRYLKNEIRIITPEILLFELTNTIKSKLLKNKDYQFEIIDKIFSIGIIFYINKEILKSALETANKISESVYDCTFIATAEHFGGIFITDDKKLYENYIRFNDGKIKVILLKDYV
jgi:predicted nucleic acid-binding protein